MKIKIKIGRREKLLLFLRIYSSSHSME